MAESTGPTYERFPSSPALTRFVEHFWTLSAPGQNRLKREILIPNGRPLLLLSFATPSTRIDPITRERFASSNALAGITTKPFVIEQPGDACYVGAQLRPYGLAGLCPSDRLVNQVMSIEHWLGKSRAAHLRALLLAFEGGRARVEALDTFLQSVLARTDFAHLPAMESAIDRIQTEGGQINIEELASQLNMSYMTLYRMFKSFIGVGPKKFADIIRYYTFVGSMLGDKQNDSTSLVASLRGYFDQAHASKEFKKFTGVTHSTFRTTLNGIALLMHET